MLKATLALAVILFSLNAFAKPQDIRLCETYRAVNASLRCSSSNYLIQFGYKYCRKYVELESMYLLHTQRVLEKIRSCLVTQTMNDSELTCANSEDRAMQHHLKCYAQAGFCSLPILEKLKVFGVAFTEIRHESFRATMLAAGSRCLGQN